MFGIWSLEGKEEALIYVFANFHGVNTPTMADLKLPRGSQ